MLARIALTALATALVMLGAPLGHAAAQTGDRIRIELEQLAPRVVDTTTQTVTIQGKITNTGDRRVKRVGVRLHRGDPLDSESALRDALNVPQESSALRPGAKTSSFEEVIGELDRGDSTRFQLTVPLGAGGPLKIDKPGVYPIAVNFNGVPDVGNAERLGVLSMLLPVLSVPGGAPVTPPANPAPLGMLWPLLDEQPRAIETPIGGGAPIFADDSLAESLSGGRLSTLLNAVQTAAAEDSSVLASLCFVLDPDLISTVAAMANGYQVRLGSSTVDGDGKDAAALWLDRLRELIGGQCVIAVPFADADIAALSRAGANDLRTTAMAAASTLEKTLGVKPQAGVVWPDGGTIDPTTLAELAKAAPTTVIADGSKLQGVQGTAPLAVGSETIRAIPYDSLLASSLAPRGVESGVKTATVQNGLATLIFRGAFQPTGGQPLLIAPPRRWSASAAELKVFLQTFHGLHTTGFARPLNVPAMVAGAATGTATGLDYSARDSGAEIPAPITAEITGVDQVKRELIRDVFALDDTIQLEPAQLLAPIESGLIRASSTAWRSRPDRATAAVAQVQGQLDAMLGRVTITNPGVPLSLASSDSPIPVYITNGLPVTVLAKVNLGDTPGLRPDQTIYVRIPANHPIVQYQPVDVSRAGLFTVDIWLTTQSGTVLGGTHQVKLNSTSYGSITLAVTGTAAGALVLLVGLRLVRKLRKRRAVAADLDL